MRGFKNAGSLGEKKRKERKEKKKKKKAREGGNDSPRRKERTLFWFTLYNSEFN